MNQESIMGLVRLICPMIASACAMAGFAVDADTLYLVVMCVLAVATIIWSWWKNNNMTEAAQEAQKYLDSTKQDNKDTKSNK